MRSLAYEVGCRPKSFALSRIPSNSSLVNVGLSSLIFLLLCLHSRLYCLLYEILASLIASSVPSSTPASVRYCHINLLRIFIYLPPLICQLKAESVQGVFGYGAPWLECCKASY